MVICFPNTQGLLRYPMLLFFRASQRVKHENWSICVFADTKKYTLVGSEKQSINKELTKAGGQVHRNCSCFFLLNASGVLGGWIIPEVLRPFSMAKHQFSVGFGFPVDRRIGVEFFANVAGSQVPVDPLRREVFSASIFWVHEDILLFLVMCKCTTPYSFTRCVLIGTNDV